MYAITAIGSPLTSSVAAEKLYTLPVGANAFLIQAQTQNVRITIDGSATSTTTGIQLKAGDPARILRLGAGQSFRALQETATAVFYVQPVKVSWVET